MTLFLILLALVWLAVTLWSSPPAGWPPAATATSARGSEPPPAEHVGDGAQHDLDVAPQRPVGDVQVVDRPHLAERTRAGPRICQGPVIPGISSSRRRYQPSTWRSSSITSGAGPTRLISPRMMLSSSAARPGRCCAAACPRASRGVVGDLEESLLRFVAVAQRILQRLGVGDHRPELQEVEVLPVAPDPRWRKNTGPRRRA